MGQPTNIKKWEDQHRTLEWTEKKYRMKHMKFEICDISSALVGSWTF